MILLLTREHEPAEISAKELRAVLDDTAYRRIEAHPCGLLFEKKLKPNAEPAFTVSKVQDGADFWLRVDCAYFIGIDWVFENAVSIRVVPKVSDVDAPAILERVLGVAESVKELEGLLCVDLNGKPVPEAHDCNRLLLFIAAAFLKIVQRIVRKGLLKTFRTEETTYRYRVKGRLRVSETLRQMRTSDPFARTACSPQRFDADSPANRFLKLVLRRMNSVLSAQTMALGSAERLFAGESARLLRAFGEVGDLSTWHKGAALPSVNPIFSEYVAALKLGRKFLMLEGLGAFEPHPNKEPQRVVPYWIDMAQLFELYVLAALRENALTEDVRYHRTFKVGGQPDFLLTLGGTEAPFTCCVADAKYKSKYAEKELDLDDARQLAGYGRLKSVIDWATERGRGERNHIIPCLIIYPNAAAQSEQIDFSKLEALKHWEDFWKVGLRLPTFPSVGDALETVATDSNIS